jgi:DNA (cytosine-5)-methyltransferase 1
MSLCAGVGGLDLGIHLAERNARTVCFVEIEAFACEVLATRMEEKIMAPAPIWTDLRSFDSMPWRGKVDCIAAGYPCQPFSVAGKKLGNKDPRHLWPDVFRVVREVEPSLCFFENVAGHLRLGFQQVHDDLCSLGYRVKAGLFTAQEIGAPHKRERLFIMAYREGVFGEYALSKRDHCNGSQGAAGGHSADLVDHERASPMDNAECKRLPKQGEPAQSLHSAQDATQQANRPFDAGLPAGFNAEQDLWPPKPLEIDKWAKVRPELKPTICGVVDGMADRMDKLRACGNGVVPLAAAYAWRTLKNAALKDKAYE